MDVIQCVLVFMLVVCIIIYIFICIKEKNYKIEKETKNININNKKKKIKKYICENCREEVEEDSKKCIYCGRSFKTNSKNNVIEKKKKLTTCDKNESNHIVKTPKIKNNETAPNKNINDKYIDVKFLYNNKIYTYLVPYKCELRKGDYCIIKQNGKEQTIKIVSDIYYEKLQKDYDYKELKIERMINDNELKNINYNVIEPGQSEFESEHYVNNYNRKKYKSIFKKIEEEMRHIEYMRGVREDYKNRDNSINSDLKSNKEYDLDYFEYLEYLDLVEMEEENRVILDEDPETIMNEDPKVFNDIDLYMEDDYVNYLDSINN